MYVSKGISWLGIWFKYVDTETSGFFERLCARVQVPQMYLGVPVFRALAHVCIANFRPYGPKPLTETVIRM